MERVGQPFLLLLRVDLRGFLLRPRHGLLHFRNRRGHEPRYHGGQVGAILLRLFRSERAGAQNDAAEGGLSLPACEIPAGLRRWHAHHFLFAPGYADGEEGHRHFAHVHRRLRTCLPCLPAHSRCCARRHALSSLAGSRHCGLLVHLALAPARPVLQPDYWRDPRQTVGARGRRLQRGGVCGEWSVLHSHPHPH